MKIRICDDELILNGEGGEVVLESEEPIDLTRAYKIGFKNCIFERVGTIETEPQKTGVIIKLSQEEVYMLRHTLALARIRQCQIFKVEKAGEAAEQFKFIKELAGKIDDSMMLQLASVDVEQKGKVKVSRDVPETSG